MEESLTFSKKYLEDLLSFFGLNAEVSASLNDETVELAVPSTHMNGFLIGQNGETMQAMQYMVSNTLKCRGFEHIRVNVDVADYKKQRDQRLMEQVKIWTAAVKKSGDALELKPMNASERRIVHQVVSESGLETESIGEGRERRVIILPTEVVTEQA